jgi:hypothetical protein
LVRDAHPTGQRSTQANLSLYHPSAATVFGSSGFSVETVVHPQIS